MRWRAMVLGAGMGILVPPTACGGQEMDYASTFELVWRTVSQTYPDTTFGGVDWADAHDRYSAQLSTVEQQEEFYRLVNRMLYELDVSHANLVPPGLLARSEPLVCAEGSPGIDIRVLEGEAVITAVTPGSSAEDAGLRPGYVIQAVDAIPVSELVREAGLVVRPPDNGRNRLALITKAILGRLYGTPGTAVAVTYAGGGERRETRLMRVRRPGRALGPGGILYLAVEFEARRLNGGIGYVRVNTFQPPLVAQVWNAIGSLGSISGLILDLRGNAGGEIEGMPDLFLEERAPLYLRRSRRGEASVLADPADDTFSGPLVLLVDQLTGSAAELLAAGLQAIGRAVVVGERSPGAVMESDMMPLPNGAIFMYPVAQLATPDGTVLEGHGVVPDVEVALDRGLLLSGRDSQLEAATGYLERTIRQ